jgi:serine/threonine protein kinase
MGRSLPSLLNIVSQDENTSIPMTNSTREKSVPSPAILKEMFPEVIKAPRKPLSAKKTFAIRHQNTNEPVGIDDFRIVRLLGKGTFGSVYLVQKKNDKRIFALKSLKKNEVVLKNTTDYVLTEKHILQNSFHPFIIRMRYSFQDENALYLIIDYMAGGDLFSHLKQRIRFSEEITKFYAAEVLLGLQYLHEKMNVTYRDLKPENILMGADGHIRIADFGLAKASDSKHYSFCGTPEYLAPEIILESGHTQCVDWWCFGCFIYELLTGRPPYSSSDNNSMYNQILNKKPKVRVNVSDAVKDLIDRLMDKNPQTRLGANGADEVKAHPFFEGIRWDQVLLKKMIPPIMPRMTRISEYDSMDYEDTSKRRNDRENG